MKHRLLIMVPALAFVFVAALALDSTASSAAAKKKTKLSVQLNKKKLSLQPNKSIKLKAKVKPSKAKVSWKSTKPKVATVSQKGKVTAKSGGSTTVIATARYKKKAKKAWCKVTVLKNADPSKQTPAPPSNQPQAPVTTKVQQIVTGQSSYTMEIGKPVSLNAYVLPADATNKNLAYMSDNPTVASVDEKGLVQPVSEGTANITVRATDGTQVSTVIQVKVISPVTSIEADETIQLKIGETYTFTPTIVPQNASLHSCSITNSKDYVASVEDDGKITAKYPGITNVTVSSLVNPEISCQFRVQVTDEFAPADGFDQYDDTIKHGELTDFYYASDYRPLGRGHALVWLPPEYDKSKQYNLLFCLHGGTDNEYYWTSDKGGTNDGCSADKVLDNAYAKGLMEDTIVVFTSGVINYKEDKEYPNVVENPLLTDFWKNHFLLEFEIINNLLPYMQQEYPVMTGPEHTGICGLSMGCAQTMEIGLKHPDLFSYVGCFSAGPFETDNQPFVTSSEDAKKLNEKLKLLFFITGENDHMMDDSMRNFVKTCDDFGVNHVFYEVPGRGHDDFCWDRCLYAFMKYAFK